MANKVADKTDVDEVLSQIASEQEQSGDPFTEGFVPGEMPDEKFELTAQEEGDLLAEAIYHGRCVGFAKTLSSKGNEQYEFDLVLLEQDRKFKHWSSLLPQARWRAEGDLAAFGIRPEGSIMRFKRSDIMNQPVRVELYHDTYEGRTREKVKKLHPADERTLQLASLG